MATDSPDRRRLECANEHDRREWFTVEATGSELRIDTPGALTRTRWSRDQARQLRDTLDELLGDVRA